MPNVRSIAPRLHFHRLVPRFALSVAVAAFISACGGVTPGEPDPDPPGPLALTNFTPLVGDTNTSVTATGSNIAGNASVTVGDTAALDVVVRDAQGQPVTGASKTGTTINFRPPVLDPGSYPVTVSQGTGEDAESETFEQQFTYEDQVFVPGDFSLYINSGPNAGEGSGPVEGGGVTWVDDQPHTGTPAGGSYFHPGLGYPIANTENDIIYQTERHTLGGVGGQFVYQIEVPEPGDYQVVLHFAEIWIGVSAFPETPEGQRVFDVALQGSVRLDDYDIYADVGPATATQKSFIVTVGENNLLTITVTHVSGPHAGKISAVEVHSLVNEEGDGGNGGGAENGE